MSGQSIYSKEQAEELVLKHLNNLAKIHKLKQFANEHELSYSYVRSYKSRQKDRKMEFTKLLLQKILHKKVDILHGFIVYD